MEPADNQNNFGNMNRIDILIYVVLGVIGTIIAGFVIGDYRIAIGGGSIFLIAMLVGYWLTD